MLRLPTYLSVWFALTLLSVGCGSTDEPASAEDQDLTSHGVIGPSILRLNIEERVVEKPSEAIKKLPVPEQVMGILERNITAEVKDNGVRFSLLKVKDGPSEFFSSPDPESKLVDFTVAAEVTGPKVKPKDFNLHFINGTVDLGFGMIAGANDRQEN